MSVTIRKLTREDAPAYWALRLEAVEREPLSFGQTPEEHRLISIEDTIGLFTKENTFFMGAFDSGASDADTLVAFARFEREPAQKERHKGHIYRVYVTASHRGHGIARTLINAIIEIVREDPTFEQLHLSVGSFNKAARAVYASLGFVSYGIEPRSMKVGSEYVDEEHMILKLR